MNVGVFAAATSDPTLEWLSRAGALGIMSAAVLAFVRGWIVSGREHDRVIAERDKALELVYKQAGLAHRTVDVSRARLEIEQQILDRRLKERDDDETA